MRSGWIGWIAIVALLAGCDDEEASASPRERAWTLVYHLPYDNDLDRFGGPILDALERGTDLTDEVAVVALVDWRGDGGMSRHFISGGDGQREAVSSDRSADPATLVATIRWAREHAPARRYAVFVLGHGGGGDVSSYDGWVDAPEAPRWMSSTDLATALREGFGDDAPPALLFLQQCGRGTLDSLPSFDGSARVVIASQAMVGAPNTYYTAMFPALAANPNLDAARLARSIVEGEGPDMFVEYTAWNGDRLGALGRRADSVREPVRDRRLGEDAPLRLTYAFQGRRWVDVVQLERLRYAAAGIDPAPLSTFERELEEARLLRRVSPRAPAEVRAWNGLSVEIGADPHVAADSGFPALVITPPER